MNEFRKTWIDKDRQFKWGLAREEQEARAEAYRRERENRDSRRCKICRELKPFRTVEELNTHIGNVHGNSYPNVV